MYSTPVEWKRRLRGPKTVTTTLPPPTQTHRHTYTCAHTQPIVLHIIFRCFRSKSQKSFWTLAAPSQFYATQRTTYIVNITARVFRNPKTCLSVLFIFINPTFLDSSQKRNCGLLENVSTQTSSIARLHWSVRAFRASLRTIIYVLRTGIPG